MSTDMKALREDIAFIRALADERDGMARDGAVLAAVGVIFGMNALLYWSTDVGVLSVPMAWRGWLWLGAVAALLITIALIARRFPPATSAASRAMSAAWSGVGTAITVAAVALGVSAWRLASPQLLTSLFPIVLFTLYGAAWGVAFAAKRRGWLGLMAVGCFAAALACGWFAGTAEAWLALSAGLLLLVALPGVLIVHRERSA